MLIGDARLLRQLYGVDDPRARAVLDAGGLVAFNRALIRDGRVAVEVFEHAMVRRAEDKGASARPAETVRVPAVHVRGAAAPEHGVLLSRVAAAQMGLEVVPGLVVFALERAPTQVQEDAASAALLSAAGQNALMVERGYRSDYGLGLLALVLAAAIVTLGAAGIATALAQADARADHATLAAVGAQPRMRRVLSALQALLISGLGTALGVAVGFVPAVAVVAALPELDLEPPWALLAGLLFGVPLLAASAAGVCTRSRLPLKQRLVT